MLFRSNPEKPIKTPDELKRFNEEIHRMIPERVNVFKIDLTRNGKSMREHLEEVFKTVRGRVLFAVDDKRIPKSLFDDEIKPRLGLEQMPDRIKMKWGAATQATSVRALPTDIKMLEEKGDIEFDQLQFTLIKLWTPVGIFHTSRDGKWYFVQAPYVRGWVHAKDIAIFETRDELKKYADADDFIVVTGESIPVYADANLTQIVSRPSMGTKMPLNQKSTNSYVLWLPERGEGGAVVLKKIYVYLAEDVSRGFMPYSQANVIRQAFKLLGARYGWGGMYNGRDCSGFTHDVFLSLGVDLPRDSKQQGFTGTQLSHFNPFEDHEMKIQILQAATPGITLLRMPLHMMLYLGQDKGHFYIIHSTWAERISMTSDEKRRINQVVVSDMTLNGNSYLGSLYNRMISANEIN